MLNNANATITSTIPTTDKTVGISEKKITPKIMAATGSPDAKIEAIPASIYLIEKVYKIYGSTDVQSEWITKNTLIFIGFATTTFVTNFQFVSGITTSITINKQ